MTQASVEGKGSSGADRSPAQHLVARPVGFDAGPRSMGSGSHAHMTAAVIFKANALVSHLDPPLASGLLNPHTAGTPWTIGESALKLDCLFHVPPRQGLVGPNVGLRAKTQNHQSDQQGAVDGERDKAALETCLQRAVAGSGAVPRPAKI